MANVFTRTPVRKPSRNTFSLSHDVKLSFDMGELIPTLVQECLPGDSFTIRNETLVRFAPLIAPVMHRVNVHTHYFFVPNRIVFPDWEKFISADLSKDDPVSWPYVLDADVDVGTLGDYMGLPTPPTLSVKSFSPIPFAAYQCIYNEYYRDENLVQEVDYELQPGQNDALYDSSLSVLRKRSWMHDYFTSALPFAQKGPSVDIPIGGFDDVDVKWKQNPSPLADGGYWRHRDGTTFPNGFEDEIVVRNTKGTASLVGNVQTNTVDPKDLYYDPNGSLYADTSALEVQSASINDLRVAFRLQEWFEKAARGGSRYIEQIMVHFGVRSSDARLNRPEFLGGSKHPVVISEVLQTSSTDATSPQGDMAGHGIAANGSGRVRYYCEEHGYIIGITSITPLTAYQQGLPRHFTRKSWEDYAWPTFAHLGEQAILNKELYWDSNTNNENTFGYTPRYSEYRYTPSRVAGDFRSNLRFWHLGRIFENLPQLNQDFIECNPRKDIFAVVDEDQDSLWCHVFNDVKVKRALPRYGVPAL